ncbi:MAG: alpha/beta hydrolase [Gammaproteobacteria bacterium]
MAQPDDLSVLTRPAAAPDDVVAYGADADQIADVRFGAEGAHGTHGASERPLVLIMHGGFWRPRYDRAHTGPMAEAIAAAGWTVASVEYRRVPGEPDKTLQDVSEALAKLPAKISHHNGKVVLVGHSAGGHLVLWLSVARRTPQLIGTLALAPAADLRLARELNLGDGAVELFLGADPKTRPDVDPRQLPSPRIPTVVVQGDRDVVVRPAVAESYVSAHPSVRLVRLTGVGHFAPIDPLSAVWPTILRELLKMSR